jgi:uncharacterized protein (DUF58 family)
LGAEPTFPLISRRRGTGLTGGSRRSVHRGAGFDVASTRPYRRGDSVRAIDWKTSARASSARSADEFIVREHFSEDRPRVVVVVDRRPEMSLYPPELPWLHKPAAVAAAGRMIVGSALAAQGFPGYLDLADPHEPRWVPPNRRQNASVIRDRELPRTAYTASAGNLADAFRHVERSRADVPPASFVFVLSDFLVSPPPPVWRAGLSHGWDVVPVIVQDPHWEQSFPPMFGFVLPLAEPGRRGLQPVRLTRHEVEERRTANERRLSRLLESFAALELDPVLLSSADPVEILAAFMRWHERRRVRLSLR